MSVNNWKFERIETLIECRIFTGKTQQPKPTTKHKNTQQHTLSALLLSLLEGKTDCPISGVFGAGKTRAAAAIIAGLITVDPSLRIMILTKENVASQAFAEHIIGLSLPTWIESKFGRLVGFMALQNQTTSNTKLDIPTAHRHDVLSSKQVIGCGGGFRHECASRYSPVAQWMSEVELALHDESQQYGNLDETAAIVRLPRNCLVLWLGDHRQTLGGLRKSTAARRFRQKLLKRPVALRGNSEKVQPNTFFQVVVRYLTGTPLSSPACPVAQLMKPDQPLSHNAHEQIETLAKELLGTYAPWLTGIVPRTALAVLWLATHRHEVESMVAQGLVEAAGLRRKQNWALILSSSARVSKVTYEAVIAVRYPELDADTPTHVAFGNHLTDRQARVGGFMPVFWRSPHNVIHATVDLGQMVAVGLATTRAGSW